MGQPEVPEAMEADATRLAVSHIAPITQFGDPVTAERRRALSMRPGSRTSDLMALQRSIGNRSTALVVARLREGPGGTATGVGGGQLTTLTRLPTLPGPLQTMARNLMGAIRAGELVVTPAQASVLVGLLTSLVGRLAGSEPEAPVPASPGMIVASGTVWLSAVLEAVLGTDVTAVLAGEDLLLPAAWLRQQGLGGIPLAIQAPMDEEPDIPPPLALESSAIRTARLNEEFVQQAAARTRADAAATRRTPTSRRQDARLERTIGQKDDRGADFSVDAHLDDQRAAARKKADDAAAVKRQQEELAAQHAPDRDRHKQANDRRAAARANQQKAAAAKEQTREQDMRSSDYARLRRDFDPLVAALRQDLIPLHPDVAKTLSSTWSPVDRVNKNLALAEADEKALGPRATESWDHLRAAETSLTQHMETLRRHRNDISNALRDTERKALERGTAAIAEANNRGLTPMLTYQFLDLRSAHANLLAAVATSAWTTVAGLTATFKAVFEQHLPTYRLVQDLTQRALYLQQQMPVQHPEVAAVQAALLTLPGLPGPTVAAEAAKLDKRLWPIQRPYAQGIFDTARAVSDAQANTALETLLDNGMIERGDFNRHYVTSYDTQGGFSVEFNIKGINNIVIHAHCSAGGVPKQGNASHWKKKETKKFAGGTKEITPKLRDALIDRSITSTLKRPSA